MCARFKVERAEKRARNEWEDEIEYEFNGVRDSTSQAVGCFKGMMYVVETLVKIRHVEEPMGPVEQEVLKNVINHKMQPKLRPKNQHKRGTTKNKKISGSSVVGAS